ncbi:MAG: FHA domain-containing protein [Phycisphaerae bacterium]|nr:FHA domain-containing protein [Phycisphaerae bacterium]NIP52353.1 FHA domain-containing protein [Phycisphaerae bacterium]NIS51344.1 FHA domain-containing protein [Phycisphaerae bacterium]NIU08956.1 FHA domain-containing protein [Phycisphaerae bacterium]NIU56625.1 FHA domain-containing protein [Phycisphaerae bacterium]
MRLVVKQKDGQAKEFKFTKGPISLGRAATSKIFLPDRLVSKQHAVIYVNSEGKWNVEDLESANKTYLNDQEIHKAEIKNGDCIRISDFTMEVSLDDDNKADKQINLEDTFHLEAALAIPPHETVVRKTDPGHAPAMRLAAKRLTDFSQATESICEADSFEKLLFALVNIGIKQFDAFHVWCALRNQPSGPMPYQSGKKRDGRKIKLSEIKLQAKIAQAVEKGQFLVLPRVSAQVEEEEAIRSALIATIMRPYGCYGVIYIDNAMKDKHYSLSDLDYLMLIAMHTAAVLRNFLKD